MSTRDRELPLSPDRPPAEPKRRPSKRKSRSAPPTGRIESWDQPELFPYLPHLREFPADDDQHEPGDLR
jgi:hypothetical protein